MVNGKRYEKLIALAIVAVCFTLQSASEISALAKLRADLIARLATTFETRGFGPLSRCLT